MSVSAGPSVVTNGLILDLDAANTKSYPGSGTVWLNLAGTSYNGTLTNSPAYSSNYGGCLTFDGTNYVVTGSLGSLPSQGSIEYWMYPTVVENYRNPFATYYNGGNSGFRWEMQTGGLFYVVIGNDAASYNVYNYPNLVANQWCQIVVTWNTATSTATGYLNGVQAFTTSSNTTWPTTIPNLSIGSGLSTGADRQFKGNISKGAVYSITLSAEQVQQNFNAIRGRYGI